MSSAAEKKAAKRRAKKEQAANQAALSTVQAITATMATSGTRAAEAAAISTAETAAPAASSSDNHHSASAASAAANSAATATAVSSDPRAQLKDRGNKAFTERRMVEAVRLFSEAIALPEPPAAAASASDASTAAASTSAAPAVATPPLLASLHSNRSAAYAALYEWNKALDDAKKCIELAPNWGKGYFRQGTAHEGLMQLPAAAAAYSAGLKADPNDLGLARALAHVNTMLRELQSAPEQGPANPEGDIFDKLVQWLIVGKARFPALYLKYYSDEYRGVHAMCDVSKDEVVLEVPLSHIMTSEVAKASDIGQQLLSSGVELSSSHTFLACYLLQERRNPNSFWKPYIDILPQHYRNLPIFFTQHELAYLKGSFTLGRIADRHAELKDEYDTIVRSVPSFATYSLEEFIWGRSVVITRIFGLMIGGTKTDGLVPMADMLNHRRPRETSWQYTDAKGAFTITALKNLSQGAQIYDSYGRKCNSRFFVNYGFSLEENPDNQAVLWLTLPPSDPHVSMKLRLLHSAKLALQPGQPRRFQIPTDYSEDPARECVSFLRFVHAKDSELLLLSANERFDVKKIEPLSLRNEREVIADLALAAQTSLSQFDATLEDDERLLQSDGLSFNVRNAVLMRRGEKQVLHYYANLEAHVQPILTLPKKEFKRWLIKRPAMPKSPYDAYIDSVVIPLMKADH